MVNIKIYEKRGNHNYKEKKILKKLKEVIESKVKENPTFLNEFTPAKDYTELNNLFNKYCVEEADYIDVTNDTQTNTTPQNMETPKTTDDFSLSEDSVFIDPLNREEPKVRSYVMDEEFPSSQPKAETERTAFAEPISFEESFELPTDDNIKDTKSAKISTDKGNVGKKPTTSTPINPDFESMDNSRKRKNSKKFAKYIVEAVCMLAEKGFVWYATKDINEAKLAEYELNNEMDLDLLVNLSDGQEATVKQFFKIQCVNAEVLSKFDDQKKQDLADALAEVMMEKGVAPTPTQELMLVGLTILGEKAIALMTITSQNNSLLAQLRSMHNNQPKERQAQPTNSDKNQSTPPPPTSQTQTNSSIEDIQYTEIKKEPIKQFVEPESQEGSFESLGDVIEKPIETKE